MRRALAACGLRPVAPPLGSLRAFEKARAKLLIPWRMITTLSKGSRSVQVKSSDETTPLPSGEGGSSVLVYTQPVGVGEL